MTVSFLSLRALKIAAISALGSLVIACGGGGAGNTAGMGAPATDPGLSVSGAVIKGPVTGASVCVYALVGGIKGPKIDVVSTSASNAQISNGCWITGADGSYNFSLPTGSSGDFLVEATGGSYCSNEVSVNAGACTAGGVLQSLGSSTLSAIVNLLPGGSTAQIYLTPFSTAALSSLPGSYNFTSFQSRFTVLSGQLGLSGLLPSTPLTTSSVALLASASQYISQGGSLANVIQSLSQGTSSYPSVTNTGTSTGTQTTGSFAPMGTASFAYSSANETDFVNGVAGVHDVAIYRAPASNPEWIGPARLSISRNGTITSAQLALANGTVISSFSSDSVLVSIINPFIGMIFGNNGGSSPVATYLSINVAADGTIKGSAGGLGQVAFRNQIVSYGTPAPAALAALAGVYTGPQQANTCGAPAVTLTFTAQAVSMNGSHSLSCSTVTYSATWDGNDDYIAPGANGEMVIRIDEAKGGGSQPAGGFTIITNGLSSNAAVVNAIVYGAGFDGNVQSDNLVKNGALPTRAQLTNKRLKFVSPTYPVTIALTSGSSIPAPFSNSGNDQISFNSSGQLLYKGTTFDYASALDTPNTTDQKTFNYNRLDAGPVSSGVSFTIRTDMSFVSGTWSRGSVMGSSSGTLSSSP
jgi:hypothetical protein